MNSPGERAEFAGFTHVVEPDKGKKYRAGGRAVDILTDNVRERNPGMTRNARYLRRKPEVDSVEPRYVLTVYGYKFTDEV